MKRCPTCQKEYADSMRFCQTDGTPLIEEIVDPFKTMIASKDEMASAIPQPPASDPFMTRVGGSFIDDDDDDLLQISNDSDSIKTMISPGTQRRDESVFGELEESAKRDLPPQSPFDAFAPNSEPANFDSLPQPEMPKFNEPDLSPPDFGSSPFESSGDSSLKQDAPKYGSNPFSDDSSNQSPFNNPPIPSPFDLSMPPGYQTPSTPPFGEVPAAPVKEPEPPPPSIFDAPQNAPFNPPAFDQYQDPFGGGQMQPTEWTPPPAPEASWQNQNIGQNTPFQPPVAGQGQNQTLAIVSLVLGLLSIPCCGFVVFGIAALVTGFLAKKKADESPSEYGGRGLALAGMIIGGIMTVIGLIVVVLQILFGVLGSLG